jgi:hypothetical protein
MANPMIPPNRSVALSRNPLNPVRDTSHGDLFVDVDDSRQAFEQFQLAFADPQWLHDGGIVVATGREQSGKSALLYRCARWLKDNLGEPEMVVKVLDCTDAPVRDAMPIESRVQKVSVRLRDKAFQANLVTDDRLLQKDTPDEIFPYLTGAISPDVVIAAILPRNLDLPGEIAEYAQLVPERVILLTEMTYTTGYLDDLRSRLDGSRAMSSILELGLLNQKDGDLFYEARRSLHPTDAPIPPVADGVLEKIVGERGFTVGDLQRLLYGVYEDIQNRSVSVPEVTYAYITDYFFRIYWGKR